MGRFTLDDDLFDEPTRCADNPKAAQSRTHRFEAQLDLCELDDRGRPTPHWSAKACELSPTRLALRTRRMLYASRRVFVAIHLIDDDPVPLCGRVVACEYEGEGLYRAELDLEHIAPDSPIHKWIRSLMHS